MVNLQPTIEAIEKLMAEGTQRSLIYAALECRLAIEALCYERLSVSHAYISHDDLKGWTPKDVVNLLIQEVDQGIASSRTISMCPTPIPDGAALLSLSDYKAMEFIPLGTQTEIDVKCLGRLWNALAGVALHVPVPDSDSAPIELYGTTEKMLPKISEALSEIKRISKRTWLTSGIGEEVSFTCQCGHINKRRKDLLQQNQTISCVMRECKESYIVHIQNDEFDLERRSFTVRCGNENCEQEIDIPKKIAESLKYDQQIYYDCSCGNRTLVKWKLVQSTGTISTKVK